MSDSQAKTEEETTDALSMSDEDFLKMVPPGAVALETDTDDAELPDATDPEDEENVIGIVEKTAEQVEAIDTELKDDDDAATGTVAKEESSEDVKETNQQEDTKTVETINDTAIDFEAEYKRLTAPFKANGRDIQVKSVDDAITLMQMGANYNKKMAALKPNLKLMKMLENNNLLSEDKIGFLIDLGNKNPAAINKLIVDSGIDPMDLNAEKASGYKQSAYTVDDREIELDTVLDEIQGTPSYNRTLEIVSTKLDAASKGVIAGSPQLLKVINAHVESGIYDQITKEIENERTFGRLVGVSDIEAYRQVGDQLHARGGFNHLIQGSSQNQGKPNTAPVVVTPKPKKVDDEALKNKKRAASSTKPAASGSQSSDFNPLALSDDEFSKLVNKQFL